MYALLTKRKVKMAGCRTEKKSKSIKTQNKKKWATITHYTKEFRFCGNKASDPERVR